MNSPKNNFLKKTIELGLTNTNLSISEIKKIKLLNVFCLCWLSCLFIFFLTDYLQYDFEQFIKNAYVHLICIFLISIVFFLQHKNKFLAARILFITIITSSILIFCFVEAGKFLEEYLILIPLISLILIKNRWINLSILILTYSSTILLLFYIDEYNSIDFQPPAILSIFIGAYLILNYSQNLNRKQEIALAIERDNALSDKIILQKQEAELRKLNEFKSHFFVNLSHEIRTPITLIKGYTSNINLKESININEEKLDIVSGQVNQIETILNNILNLSKLDANKLSLERNDIEIIPFLNKHYADFKALFNNKNIAFNLNTNNLNFKVNMDANLIEKSINNLLSNALKFTPKNGIVTIDIDLKNDLEISIKDNGLGIPEKDLDKIFERFYQSKNHITKSQGSGIGLSFTKSILDTHGFSILVESTPNIQTIFKIIIPKHFIREINNDIDINKETNNNTLKKEPTLQLQKNENVKTILIVDDHEQMRSYLANTLKTYNILEAEDGKEALTILKSEKIDLLLTDYMMPIMDGKALVKEVKKMNLKIPVIVLTARVDQNAKLNMLRIGVDGYLNKPFVEEELLLFIKKSLELYSNIINTQKDLTVIEKNELDKTAQEFNQKILNFITDNISDTDFTVQDIANYLNISQSTLNRKTKNILGQTPQQVIMHLKVEKAKELQLKNPYLSKKEIGYQVGISNTTYLFKKIKEAYGRSN